jgi:hypothetical protein
VIPESCQPIFYSENDHYKHHSKVPVMKENGEILVICRLRQIAENSQLVKCRVACIMLAFITIKMACDFYKLISAEPRQIDKFCKLITNFFCV